MMLEIRLIEDKIKNLGWVQIVQNISWVEEFEIYCIHRWFSMGNAFSPQNVFLNIRKHFTL